MPGRRRILIAEDDSLVRELVRSKLTSAGYDAHTARCGREAIEWTFLIRPHVLLLDLNLPDVDGFAVLKAIREGAIDAPPAALVLTASRASDHVQRAIALGARDYLTKDMIQSHLLPRLARMLRSLEAGVAQAA